LSDLVEIAGKHFLLALPRTRTNRAWGAFMLGFAGLISVMAGGITAYIAERFPAHVELLHTVGGLLLIGGFGLVGCALPTMI
jgi:hypothetical protein